MHSEPTAGATGNGRQLAADIRNVREQVLAGFLRPAGEGLKQATELIFREPAMTAQLLMHATGQSCSAAYRNIERLEQAGALKAAGHVNGHRAWIAPKVIAALDDFAARAGRRVSG